MLFNGISRLGKSFIKILKVSRANKNKKRRQKSLSRQSQFQETRNRKFTRSKYAKLIPSENFAEERHRSNLYFVTDLEQKQTDNEKFSKVFRTHQKHKCIIRSTARALKYETKAEKQSFLRNVEQLIQNLKAFTDISDDEDLLAMYTAMTDIWKEHQRNWLHKTIPRKERNPRKVFARKAGGDFANGGTNKTRAEGKQPEGSTLLPKRKTVAEFEQPIPGQKHSCEVQECLKNSTPQKAVKKPQTLCFTRTSTPSKLEEIGSTYAKQNSLDNLNFSYGGLKENFLQIEASRLNVANEAHCKAVAKIVDDRLKRKQLLTPHLVCMYADFQDGSNNVLSKLKHDILKTCLNTFFFPRQNSVNISWTDKVDTLLSCSTSAEYLTDIFERRYELVKCCFKAVMVMSGTAADLLRHKQLAVLDTVAVVLGIPRKSLLIVHKWEVPQLFY